jgi:hypothetical protein
MISIIDRLRGLAHAMPPVNNGTPEGGYAYEAEVMLRAADELAAMQARAERAEKDRDHYKSQWALAIVAISEFHRICEQNAPVIQTARSEARREGE